MKYFKIKTLEQEQTERHYLIDAENEERAKEKFRGQEEEEELDLRPIYESRYDFIDKIDNIEEISKEDYDKLKDLLKKPKYKEAYYILMEYFDSICDEEKPEVDKRLEECGL